MAIFTANESLFKAGISPLRPANKLTKKECTLLVETVKAVLQRAIETGGSTLRDFVNSDGKSGYFQQEYTVYGRHNEPCVQCGGLILKKLWAAWNILLSKLPEIVSDGLKCKRPSENNEHNTEEILCLNKKLLF